MAIAHSVLWLCSALAEERPLALVVDDAHWADRAVAGGARLPRAADRRPAAADRRRRARRRSRRGLGPAQPIGGARAATVLHPQPLTPQGAVAAHPSRGAGHAGRGLPRLPSRGRRQPVAAGRARPPARRPRRGALDASERRRAAAQRDRAHRRPRAPGRAVAARPRRRRGARGDRRGRAAPGHRGRGRRRASTSWAPRATRWWPPGCSRAGGTRFAHHLIASRDRRRPAPRAARAPAPRDGARADGRRRRRRQRRQPPAALRRRAPTRRSARCCAAPRSTPRNTARPTPPRPTSSARWRSAPRATTAGACWPSSRRSPSTPACPTRASACARPWPRHTTATAGSTS